MSALLHTRTDRRPGLDPRRLRRLMASAVLELELELAGRVVVTEAATGAYGVTPVLAALAGAREVHAVAGDSRFGTEEEAIASTENLAAAAGVGDRIELLTSKDAAPLEDADIVTNSGHLRPLDGPTVARMKPGAAIPLMYEAWELRSQDVDLAACRLRGIRFAGTNERHPAVGVFSFLGLMAMKLLTDAGVAVCSSRLLLLCDNPFRAHIERSLVSAGAQVVTRERLQDGPLDECCDAVIVALRPAAQPLPSAADAAASGRTCPRRRAGPVLGRRRPRRAVRRRGARVAGGAAGARPHGDPALGGRAGADRPSAGRWAEGRRGALRQPGLRRRDLDYLDPV